jgi:hypothetical protein
VRGAGAPFRRSVVEKKAEAATQQRIGGLAGSQQIREFAKRAQEEYQRNPYDNPQLAEWKYYPMETANFAVNMVSPSTSCVAFSGEALATLTKSSSQ